MYRVDRVGCAGYDSLTAPRAAPSAELTSPIISRKSCIFHDLVAIVDQIKDINLTRLRIGKILFPRDFQNHKAMVGQS